MKVVSRKLFWVLQIQLVQLLSSNLILILHHQLTNSLHLMILLGVAGWFVLWCLFLKDTRKIPWHYSAHQVLWGLRLQFFEPCQVPTIEPTTLWYAPVEMCVQVWMAGWSSGTWITWVMPWPDSAYDMRYYLLYSLYISALCCVVHLLYGSGDFFQPRYHLSSMLLLFLNAALSFNLNNCRQARDGARAGFRQQRKLWKSMRNWNPASSPRQRKLSRDWSPVWFHKQRKQSGYLWD